MHKSLWNRVAMKGTAISINLIDQPVPPQISNYEIWNLLPEINMESEMARVLEYTRLIGAM